MSNLRDLVGDSLRSIGFDGLLNDKDGCFCHLGDLMPCDKPAHDLVDCKPAIERVCPTCGEAVFVNCDTVRRMK